MKNVLIFLAFIASFQVTAGTASGKVTDITLRTKDDVLVVRMDNYESRPDCVTWAHPLGIVYKGELAKAIYSMLLSAQATGQRIRIQGSGKCSEGTSGYEIIEQVNLGPWG
ncbi:hypothetical protein A3759_18940 [Thalassolituus sp. HI0120]|nr:hypothetical protein A3759_13970 [Thalassolituus sp. HI0120]KZZ46153.1 hypothetical protein A3759_18940 [Thalassolituus sp. HI0120]